MTKTISPDAASQLALELAANTDKWAQLVRHDPAQRTYAPLEAGPYAGAWLICWMPGHDTGFHDHDHSSGAVAIVSGQVREERIGEGFQITGRTYEPGEVISFVKGDIHRMVHAGEGPAVSIHVYSPRLEIMGAYAFGKAGMQRYQLDSSVELKPLEAAG